MLSLKPLFQSLTNLFYPHICNGCGSDLLSAQNLLCINCIELLPHTQYEKYPNNPIERIFIGRLPIVAAHSEFYFAKGQLVQHLIHDFKYKGNRDIGIYLSNIMGENMMSSNRFNNIDYIIPLPLFADKEYKRGFNQAAVISDGIAMAMKVPVLKNEVLRIKFTETQTKKIRTERWDNVSESFTVKTPQLFQNKHVLIVDDVITTGATIDACAQKIAKIPGVKISIATLTTASK
jgi:ComF family protein